MKSVILIALAFSGGAFLAIHAGFNSQLSTLLKNPVLTATVSSAFSVVFTLVILLTGKFHLPPTNTVQNIPVHLWIAGGLFSVIGISIYFYTIPRIGISRMIGIGLCGQLTYSVVAAHFGWFGVPKDPVTWKSLTGLCVMLIGVILIQSK